MVGALIDLLVGPVGAFLAGAIGIAGAWLVGRRGGAQRERDKAARARLEDIRKADSIDDAVAGRTPDENRERLKRW